MDKLLIIIGLHLLVLSACQSGKPQVTEDYILTFCLDVEAAVNQNNTVFINSVFNSDYIISQATNGINAPEYYETGFKTGFLQVYNLGDIMAGSIGNEGSYKFMKLLQKGDTINAFFRATSEFGLNYHEVKIVPNQLGNLNIIDMYSYADGDIFSQSIRRLYILNLVAEIDSFTHPLAEHLPAINEIAKLADSGDYEMAFKKSAKLPPVVQDEKVVQLIQLQLANSLSIEKLDSLKDLFIEKYPDDKLIYLKAMEMAFERQDFDAIVKNIDELDKQIGGDPYLKLIKASVYHNNIQDDVALKLAKQCINEEPDNDEAYWLVLDILIIKKEYEKAIEYFVKMKHEFDVNAAEYIVYDGYTDFYESQPYQQWITDNPLDKKLVPLPDSTTLQKLELELDKSKHNHEHKHGHNHDHEHKSGHDHIR